MIRGRDRHSLLKLRIVILHVWEVWNALLPTPHGSHSQDRLSDGVQHPDVEDCPVLPEPGVRQRRAEQPGGVTHELEGVEYNGACTFCLLKLSLFNSVYHLKFYTYLFIVYFPEQCDKIYCQDG